MKNIATVLLTIAAMTTVAACGTSDVLRVVGNAGGTGGGGYSGMGGDPGSAGNEDSAGSGGNGGTGGAGGSNLGEIAAYLEILSDFPEVYGSFNLQVERTQIQATDRIPDGCSGETTAVFGVPEGSLDITIRSEMRFKWVIETEVAAGDCKALFLSAEDSASSFNFFGANIKNGARRLPVDITVNQEFAARLEKTFSLDEAIADPRGPSMTFRELFLHYVTDGRLFILPLNDDDVYPINLLARTATGGTFFAPYSAPDVSGSIVHAF